jgi:hypothetical protein
MASRAKGSLMTVEIDALDQALAAAGQTVALTCRNPSVTLTDIPASVRGYSPQELTSNITQQDSKVILSPTQINNATWPGTQVPGTPDIRIPNKNRGDTCTINGVARTVQAGVGIYVKDVLVRIELQVR